MNNLHSTIELKAMTGYGNSYEIRIPTSLRNLIGIKVIKFKKMDQVVNLPVIIRSGKKEDAQFVICLNDKRNIEIIPTYKKWKRIVNGLFTVSSLRTHGGSVVLTIPYSVREAYEFLGIKYQKFTGFKNKRGNLEFKPIQ